MNSYANYGYTLYEKGLLDKAEEYFNKALEADPACADAYQGLGAVYFSKKDFDKSIEFSTKAIDLFRSLEPFKVSNCFYNLAVAYKAKKDILNALFCYENAILLNINNYNAYFGISVTYLLSKDFENGFKLYRSRFFKTDPVKSHFFENKKEWQGEDIKDKTLYVYYEQGYGDNIQFVRYLKDLSNLTGAKILYKSEAELETLFEENDLNINIVKNSIEDSEVEFDVYTHLLSIPKLINADINNIPLADGYLQANQNKVKEYKNKYFNNENFKVGIVWKGTYDEVIDKIIPLDCFLPFLNIPNIKIYSLQKEITIEEKSMLKKYNIENLGKTFNDFSDTAAAIKNLDLLISVDTSVVHLAGALNKSVWVLLSYIPEWRWFLDSVTTPWYNSAKLYRQDESRCWTPIIKKALNDLENFKITTDNLIPPHH